MKQSTKLSGKLNGPGCRTLVLATVLFLLLMPARAQNSAAASTPVEVQGRVSGSDGRPVAHALIEDAAGRPLALTDASGRFSATLPAGTGSLRVEAPTYMPATIPVTASGAAVNATLTPLAETVTVTAYRSPLSAMDSPVSTRILSQQRLRQAAPPGLDGKLRQVPGLELFRRSSSLVTNPTSQGVSLRGLGSTAASRTLVVSDDVPLNDPFGGWIHWEEVPELSIRSVEIVRGGASDLYGSSAIGGVISLLPERPTGTGAELSASYGALHTYDEAARASLDRHGWGVLAAGGTLGTGGYILVAPQDRGPVDRPSNVHAQNGLLLVERRLHPSDRLFLRGNVFNEARDNGTPLQKNATRLWRYAAGADLDHGSWGNTVLRLYGSTEHYRQTFSAILPGRVGERLIRYGEDPASELGAQFRWRRTLGPAGLLLAGADTRDVRAADDQRLYTGAGFKNTAARQRQSGVFAEMLFTPAQWTVTGSARVDHFSNFDAVQSSPAGVTALPAFSETVFNPRLGLTRRITPWLALSASAFRAFRAPTENELYRTIQVVQRVTLPNPELRSERATGWEAGAAAEIPRWDSTLRASWFWTQVNRPITALTLEVTPEETTLQRENLGRIESRGVSLDYDIVPLRWLTLSGGYQYADATVTRFDQQPQLVGKWIPQVARNMATAQLRLERRRIGLLSLQARMSGRQYEDDQNRFLLHGFFRLDAYASRAISAHLEAFAAGENLLDRAMEVGRTPLLTLGTPLTGRFGLRLRWGVN